MFVWLARLSVWLYGETVRNKGSQGNRYGQAVLFDGLSARVSRWPPLRLVRLRRERESVSVGSPNPFPLETEERGKVMPRFIGMDVHRDFAQIAVVATARKMLVLAWHLVTKDEDYAFARPSLVAFKRRKLELAAGAPKAHARRGAGYDYNDKQLRKFARDLIEKSEQAYERLVAGWQPSRPAGADRIDFHPTPETKPGRT